MAYCSDGKQWSLASREFNNHFYIVCDNQNTGNGFQLSSKPPLCVTRVTSEFLWVSGLRVGDQLVCIDGQKCSEWDSETIFQTISRRIEGRQGYSMLRFALCVNDKYKISKQKVDVVYNSIQHKLGIAIIGDGIEDVPVVMSVSTTQYHNKIKPGDILVAINGTDAIALGLQAIVTLLEKCDTLNAKCSPTRRLTFQRTLRECNSLVFSAFRSQSRVGSKNGPDNFVSEPEDVTIIWRHGKLGILFVKDLISGLPSIRKLTGKGYSTGLEKLKIGSLLVSVNGISVNRNDFHLCCKTIGVLDKPVILVFSLPYLQEFDNSNSTTESSICLSSISSSASSSTHMPDCICRKEANKLHVGQYHGLTSKVSGKVQPQPNSLTTWPDQTQIDTEIHSLIFATAPSCSIPSTYEIIWDSSSLGLMLMCIEDCYNTSTTCRHACNSNNETNVYVYIGRIARGLNAKTQTATRGDLLIQIDETKICFTRPKLSYNVVIEYLQALKLPVKLVFQRKSRKETAVLMLKKHCKQTLLHWDAKSHCIRIC